MKSRSVFLLLAAALLLPASRAAQAQALPAPAPPAYAVAQRLTAEARAAAAAHDDRTTRDRAVQAAAKYREVVSSHQFGSGPWGAEALYQQALVQRDDLHDDNAAVLSLQQLQNNYRNVDFPDRPNASPALITLEGQVDARNKATPPGSILYGVMDFFVKLFGGKSFSYSYALAILFISVLVRLALTPISNKQFASMREMQKLQPAIKELQGKYKGDKEMMGKKTMELYKEHNINPAAGCLPMLFQLPILYLLYYMIRLYQFQFVHGHFLWVGSPLATLFPGIVAPNLGQQDIPLLVLYALSMYVTQKLTITPSLDPQQAEQQRQMAVMTPFISTIFFLQWHLPSAFVLYYLIFNILSTAQQKYYMRKRHADIHGEPDVDKGDGGGDGGTKKVVYDRNGSGGNGSGNGARPYGNGAKLNGTTPTAKGIIGPQRSHPKKKRR